MKLLTASGTGGFVLLSALALALRAQERREDAPPTVTEIAVPGSPARARLWTEPDAAGRSLPHYSLSLDGQRFSAPRATSYELELRYRRFDPLHSSPAMRPELCAAPGSRLFIVQYWTQGIEPYRARLRELGGEIHLFLANNANVVELAPGELSAVRALPFVRAVTPFHPAYKLEEELLLGLEQGRSGPITVNLLTLRRGGHAPVVDWIEAHGGTIEHVSEPTYLMTARFDFEQLPALAALDEVQWIDRWGPPGNDMNIARELHGSDYVEALHGLTGQGVRIEVMDGGFDTNHPDMQNYLVHNGNNASGHGTCTSGIVLGSGAGNASARGGAPDAFLVVADYDWPYAGGSRYAHTGQLVNPALSYQCVLQSNSWGSPWTTTYSSTSHDMDLILFDHARISICQSQSNLGSQSSRPEAWAKNIIAVGGLYHLNTLSKSDDSWSGGASIGPAADGRIKPDLASFYDSILCADQVGSLGYSSNNYFSGFGGTSGATPIVAGHLAIVYQMWHEGLFGNPHPGATVFENAPNNTTAKALLINGASQWNFSGTTHDRTRTHQGWGHPDLQRLSQQTARMVVVDEYDLLTELESHDYLVVVLPGEANLRVTLVYRDPPGTTSSSVHRVNDLDLLLTSPGGVVYHGNYGLNLSTLSLSGGSPNTRDTVENVFIAAPEAGVWTVTVSASEVNQDSHVETGEVDVDYALVISGADELPPAPPLAPSDLGGSAAAHRARLEFVDHANNELGFELERSLNGIDFQPLVALAANKTSHEDTGLSADTTYYYRVRAFNGLGSSDYSNVLCLHTRRARGSGPP
jgi:hypothetical protein